MSDSLLSLAVSVLGHPEGTVQEMMADAGLLPKSVPLSIYIADRIAAATDAGMVWLLKDAVIAAHGRGELTWAEHMRLMAMANSRGEELGAE